MSSRSEPDSWKPSAAERRKIRAAVRMIDKVAKPAIRKAIQQISNLPRTRSLCLGLQFANAQLDAVRNYLIQEKEGQS